MLSVSSCRAIRAAPAPSAARMAISLPRATALDSRTLATFAHAMSSTIAAAARSTINAVRVSSDTTDSANETTLTPKSLFDSGKSFARPPAMAVISACA